MVKEDGKVFEYKELKHDALIKSLDNFGLVQVVLSNNRVKLCEKLFETYNMFDKGISTPRISIFLFGIKLVVQVLLFHSNLWGMLSFYRIKGFQCESFIKRGDTSSVLTFRKK